LPSVVKDTRQRPLFAECLLPALGKLGLCRVPCGVHSAKITAVSFRCLTAALCRAPFFAESRALGIVYLCRVFVFAECFALGTYTFAECFPLPRATLGKMCLCRVPDVLLSANDLALGKDRVSGSGSRSEYGYNFKVFLDRCSFSFRLIKIRQISCHPFKKNMVWITTEVLIRLLVNIYITVV
jgi:hypothetical protein